MCRIAGIVNPSIETGELQLLVKGMCNLLQHGGPDDEGIYANPEIGFVFGHRRLAIIDTSNAGHQPMQYSNNRFTITYNGELYNYPELKSELKTLGFQFNTATDTEVVLAAFAAWGTNAFCRFNGMFAFAIWDNETKEIVIARGSAGIKPLYFAITKEGFAFASEIKAFQNIHYLQTPNDKWPIYLMAYGHLPEPVTTLKHVQPLEKGTYLKYNTLTKAVTTNVFARINYIEKIDNRADAIHQIQLELDAAVKRHLIADAPIGVFLSGGLDSSIIAMLAHRHQEQLMGDSGAVKAGDIAEPGAGPQRLYGNVSAGRDSKQRRQRAKHRVFRDGAERPHFFRETAVGGCWTGPLGYDHENQRCHHEREHSDAEKHVAPADRLYRELERRRGHDQPERANGHDQRVRQWPARLRHPDDNRLEGAHQSAAEAETDDGAADQQGSRALPESENQRADAADRDQRCLHAPWPVAIEQDAER